MSLGKLLASGRSLIGGAPGEGRYNISNANRLPKFGSVKNPFAPATTSEARESGSGTGILPVQCEEQTQAESSAQAEPSVSRECSADRLEACPTRKAVAVRWLKNFWRFAQVCAVATWVAVRGIKWRVALQVCRSLARVAWDKLKFISIKLAGLFRRREQPEPKPLFPRFGKSVVQAELSLDSIKVVRNTLEDSDLEIVTAETRTGTQVAPTTQVAQPKRGPVPAALKKMTGVILKR